MTDRKVAIAFRFADDPRRPRPVTIEQRILETRDRYEALGIESVWSIEAGLLYVFEPEDDEGPE